MLGNRDDDVGLGFAREWRVTRSHFVEHDAETPDVGARIDRFAARLLGRHVLRCSQNHPRIRLDQSAGYRLGVGLLRDCSFGELCQAKIQNLNVAVAANHYVFRFDVAMNDPGGVRFL